MIDWFFHRGGASTLALFLVHSACAAGAESFFADLEPPKPDPELGLTTEINDWHKDAVIYHLWVAAFRDFDGDGTGDLQGIIRSLDVLHELGVNVIWLSPFFQSASRQRNLHGYDVTDHYRVDPRLGTDADADELVRAAHALGIRLIFDFVPNHVSSRHPWFIESQDPRSPKRDWFVWRDEPPQSGWTGFDRHSDWHPHDHDHYYGVFWSGMPDVNHRNPEVRLELARAAQYWLNRGLDGIRMDAVRYLYENLEGDGAKSDQENQPETIAWFEDWRRSVMDPYAKRGYAKFMVAENWTADREELSKYLHHDGQPVFDMTLNFPLLPALTRLDAIAARESWEWAATLPANGWLGNFVSNHDLAADRPGTLFGNEPQKLRAQTAWLLLGPGTPFIYYGNEIAQPQGPQPGDTKHRQPLDWSEVKRQRADPGSIWHWHGRLIRLRHDHASLRRGAVRFLQTDSGPDVMAIFRKTEGDTTLTILSGSADEISSVSILLPEQVRGHNLVTELGNATAQVTRDDTLKVRPLGPYSSTVFSFQYSPSMKQ